MTVHMMDSHVIKLNDDVESLKTVLLDALGQSQLTLEQSIERLLSTHSERFEQSLFERLEQWRSVDFFADVATFGPEPDHSHGVSICSSGADHWKEHRKQQPNGNFGPKDSKGSDRDEWAGDSVMASHGKLMQKVVQRFAQPSGSNILLRHRSRPLHPCLHTMVSSHFFEAVSVLCVIANACVIGIQADWASHNRGENTPDAFMISDVFFLAIFAVELLLRMMAAGRFFFSWLNHDLHWNMFDTVLVLVTCLEVPLYMWIGRTINLTAARLVRLMRLVRLLRVVRLFRFFKQLRIVVQSVAASLKPLLWALALLFIVIYLSSVIVLQLINDSHEADGNDITSTVQHHYGSLVRTQYTLFLCVTNGVSWHIAADPLMRISSAFAVFFVVFISFCFFCMLNIVTGIFVENAKQMTEHDDEAMLLEEAANREQWMTEVVALFEAADEDGSGDLTLTEFEKRLQDLRIQVLLKNLGIDVLSVNPKGLFNTLDFNKSGLVTIDEFANGIMRFHGHARSLELAEMKHFQMKLLAGIKELRDFCQTSFAEVQRPSGKRRSAADYSSPPSCASTPRAGVLAAHAEQGKLSRKEQAQEGRDKDGTEAKVIL